MRLIQRFIALGLVASAVTCTFPSDRSNEVIVLIEAPHTFLLRGQEMSVHARAVRIAGSDTVDVPNVDFQWSSGSGGTARVDKNAGGYATVTGVNPGRVDIIARAIAFEKSTDGDLNIRVANPLEIDSVRPRAMHYGQVATVYGIGVDSIFVASLGGADLIEYPFSRVRNDTSGDARMSFWVPPPARSDNLFYIGAGVFGIADSVTTIIDSADIFEPNDTNPALVNLDAGVPFPQVPNLLFINPALSFEPVERGTETEDWFKFLRADTTQSTTFFVNYPSFGDTTTRTFLLDSLGFSGFYTFRDSVQFVGSNWDYCKGSRFTPLRVPRESLIVALKGLPSSSISIITFFQRPQRYGLRVVNGYVTSDSRIGPDQYEENDMCRYVDQGPARISLSAPFSDTLTIDNPFDVDWLRIDIPGSGLQAVQFGLNSRPFPGETDFSDIDLYVLTVPGSSGFDVSEVGSSLNGGSSEGLSLGLTGGLSYYVAVVDYAGVPERYSLCMAVFPAGCVTIPAPPHRTANPATAAAKAALIRKRQLAPPTAPGDRSNPFLRP